MPQLSRDEFLSGAAKPRRQKVMLPELGEEAYLVVRALSAGERALFEASLIDPKGDPNPAKFKTFRERLLILATVDEATDAPVFKSGADIQELATRDSGLVGRLSDAIQDLSGMDKDQNRKRIEDLSGN